MTERITGHTELIGLIAYPIRHSKSPTMHNEAFMKLGLDYAYLCFEVDNETLEDTVKGFRAMKVRGWNVSMPNKTVIGQYLDKLTPAAELCGAVNTVVNDNGVLTGTITDGTGMMRALKESGVDPIGKKMTIAGAGGAATAIEIQAALDGVAEIAIFNRKDEFWARAEQNVKNINEKTNCKATLYDLADTEALRREIADSYIFMNATGVGMKPLEGQMVIPDETFLRPDLIVADTVYMPRETKLLETARKVGCQKVINGEGMMLFQGAAAFKLWTGQDMPIDHIKDVLDIQF
ncbi:MAG: shikimate dehydrogenase [Bacillota bacterium]|nr:shikimate dehydrogenase [Bacillota bacterium]